MTLAIKTAEQLIDPALEARWAARRAGRQGEVLQQILRIFVERQGPVPVAAVTAAIPHHPPAAIEETIRALDEQDLVQVVDGQVVMAYPFSATRTPFRVRLAEGRERYACCAIDALGIAPMIGGPVRVHSECHHCGAPLTFSAGPDGPGPEAEGLRVWVGERAEGQRRISTSL
jgi:hypothetical protein